jgi:chromosome segregation ATPase
VSVIVGRFNEENSLKSDGNKQTKHDDVNQSVFYSKSVDAQVRELQQMIKSYSEMYKKVLDQLEDQENMTQKLEKKNKKFQQKVVSHEQVHKDLSTKLNKLETTTQNPQIVEDGPRKSDLEQNLMSKLEKYEEKRSSMELELQKLSKVQKVLTERLDSIEQVNKDLFAEINQYSIRLNKQELHKGIKKEGQQEGLLQKFDYDELLQKVKKNEAEQKKIKESFKELVDITSTISTQISKHEKVQLELFSKLNHLQSAGSNQPKKPISIVNSKMTQHPTKIERSKHN